MSDIVSKDSQQVEKILVIKHGALGDFVLQSGALRAIRQAHPRARITLITEKFLKELAECMGFFDEVVVDSRGYDLFTWYNVVKRTIADRKWNAIYDLQSSNRTLCRYYPLALLVTGNAMRWRAYRKCGPQERVSTRKIPFLPWLWRTVPCQIPYLPADLSMCHGAHAHFDELPEKYALIIPGCSAGNEFKRWPPQLYRELTTILAGRGMKSVVIGTKAEAREINMICNGNENAVNFLGKNSIADIPDLANGAKVVIGNDTGPSHIAHIAGARVVMIFVDKYFEQCSPKGKENVISLHAQNLADLSVSEVAGAVQKVMRQC